MEGKQAEIELPPMTLEEAYGSLPPLNRPEDFDAIQQIANEEREARWLQAANPLESELTRDGDHHL
jgi:hypothetical protein